MDGRILPETAFGIQAGTVNVLRSAGGRVATAISSILVSQVALGSHEIMVGEWRLSPRQSMLRIDSPRSAPHGLWHEQVHRPDAA